MRELGKPKKAFKDTFSAVTAMDERFLGGWAWQPIETAPKDGSIILTYGMGHGNEAGAFDANERAFPMYGIAFWWWHDSERDVEVSPGLFRKEPCRVLEGWKTEWAFTPTHWMPLPEPPA